MKTKSSNPKKPKAKVRDMNPKKDAKGGNENLLISTTYGRGSFAIR
jgi:hypothetical protein